MGKYCEESASKNGRCAVDDACLNHFRQASIARHGARWKENGKRRAELWSGIMQKEDHLSKVRNKSPVVYRGGEAIGGGNQ